MFSSSEIRPGYFKKNLMSGHPNHNASQRNLLRIGVRLPPWATFATSVFAGILDYSRLNGRWSLYTENNAEGELETLRLGADWDGDGLITFRCSPEEVSAWERRGMPVVNISSEGETGPHPRVIPDNAQVGALAAGHLMESGLDSFAFVGRAATAYSRPEWAPGPRRYARERLDGFASALAGKNVRPAQLMLPPRDYTAPETWRKVRDEVARFLDTLPRPCGIFAADDPLAVVVIRAMESIGARIPEDFCVVGFGDDPAFCHMTSVSLTSVCYPGHDLGYEAARALALRMADDPKVPVEKLVPVTRIAARKSTDFLAIGDPEVARLVRLIRNSATADSIQVSELLEQTRLSASTLKVRFNAALGHGPKREILLTRVRRLKQLLAETGLADEAIAKSAGFPSSEEMSRFLFRHTGQKPASFRTRNYR